MKLFRPRLALPEMKVLRIERGDVVLVQGPPSLSMDQALQIERAFNEEGVRAIIVGGGLSVEGVASYAELMHGERPSETPAHDETVVRELPRCARCDRPVDTYSQHACRGVR